MKEIQQLIDISRKYGADPRYVIAGGGNTSFKTADRLWVKASGHALATIDEDGFAIMDRSKLDIIGNKAYSDDSAVREAQVKEDLAAAAVTKDRRPSVETSLHNCISYPFVVHLHPMAVNALMCSQDAAGKCAEIFPDALYIPYCDPGYTLFKKVYDGITAWKEVRGCEPRVIFLQNHGVFVGGNSTSEIDALYTAIVEALEERIAGRLPAEAGGLPVTAGDDKEGAGNDKESAGDSGNGTLLTELVPFIRQVLSRGGRGLKTLRVTSNALTGRFSASEEAFGPVSAPFTPDMIVYCKSHYIFLDDASPAAAESAIEAYTAKYGHTPKVIMVKGLGLIAAGDDDRNAGIITEVYLDAMKIAAGAAEFGGPHAMEPAWIEFIDSWEAENYRRKLSASQAGGRVQGKTIIVTGAAQGFGEGIARELAAQGANIVVADLNADAGSRTAASIDAVCMGNRAIFVKTDVSSLESLKALMHETVANFGAVDVFVSNAGVVRAGDLEKMSAEDMDFVTRINYSAYFYCAKTVSHIMKIQTAADPEYYADIVQINSKSGLQGSKANFAYAGSKFGGIGLTQSFALELAPYRIKVNSVCPGNYYDGPLWSNPQNGLFIQYLNAGKVPGAKTVQDVKEYYLSKVPMNKGCTPKDVVKAILYAVEQTGETGQALPVTGGQVMLS